MPKMTVAATHLHPAFDGDFDRVNVLLGANGVGKSSLLRDMRNYGEFLAAAKLTRFRYVDGGRVLRPVSRSNLQRNVASGANAQVADGLLQNLDFNVADQHAQLLLENLCQDHGKAARDHSDACLKLRSEKPAEIPERSISQLDTFKRLFEETFPFISLEFDVENVQLQCIRNGQTYGPETFSTGERQVFLLLAKFIADREPSAFLVDEPEQNLNPKLADRFWGIMERYRRESSFVYTTHALHFALRPDVDKIFVLTPTKTLAIDDLDAFQKLPKGDREDFLGSIPSIVVSQRVLLTEGVEGSVDEPIYRYVLQQPNVRIVSLGDCMQVRNAVRGSEGWDRITTGVEVRGIIDRDFKSASQLESIVSNRLLATPFHEAESILCHPAAVSALSKKMWPTAFVSAGDVLAMYAKSLERDKYRVALRRAFEAIKDKVSFSAAGRERMAAINDDQTAVRLFDEQKMAFSSYVNSLDAEKEVMREINSINQAITSGDAAAILKFSEGKAVMGEAKRLLRPGSETLLSLYEHHFPKADIEPFTSLRSDITNMFSMTDEGAALKMEAEKVAS